MSAALDQKIIEWAKWREEHKLDGGDVFKKIEFLNKSIDGLMELLAQASQAIRDLEGRKASDYGSPLYRPGQLSVRGDLRRLG